MIPVNDLLLMLEIGRIKVTVVNGFPDEIEGFTVATSQKFDIWISSALPNDFMIRVFKHELWHIMNHDFNKTNVQEIEQEAHWAQDNNFFGFFEGFDWAKYLRTAKVISMKEGC